MIETGSAGLRRRKFDRSISEEPSNAGDSAEERLDDIHKLNDDPKQSLLSEPEHEDDEDVFRTDASQSQTPQREATRLNHVRLSQKLSIILGEEEECRVVREDLPAPTPSDYQPTRKDEVVKVPKKLSTWEFIWLELTRGYSLENDQDRYTEKRRKVYAFHARSLRIGEVSVLRISALPGRMAFFGSLLRIREWTAAETCDLLKIVIIVIASIFMQAVDTSMLYHLVRGQGVIKLYIFYNMLEVADKLFSSFGQDILDTLLWTASERGKKRRFILTTLHIFAAILYAALHALLVLFQATTLNVAFNSYNQSLLTIMLSNNFVELKGAVFKKFAKPNLFQMACSDCRERFHTIILLVVVVLRNMTAVNWKFEHLIEMLPDLFMVVIAEVIVDWLKHAFITKFNEISAEVYQDFTITLAFDVVKSHEKDSFTDFSDQVSRRMGFIPIPITIMLIRVIGQSIDFSRNVYIIVFALIWLGLCTTKILNGVFLHSNGVDHIARYRMLQQQAENNSYRKRMVSAKSKSAPNSPRLSLIDFSDVLTQAAQATKGITASDILSQWGANDFISVTPKQIPQQQMSQTSEEPQSPAPPTPNPNSNNDAAASTPRRSQSMGETSMPPTIDEEGRQADEDVKKEVASPRQQQSPKRRVTECESLSEVQAYTLLNASDGTQEIQS
ncbi:hypothetical protein M3Y97_01069300 [Aphelenchoides bicaudatus]|nr:hypothetical protein M3Y97_01069300 [Aphelenchoides bicaudatus]